MAQKEIKIVVYNPTADLNNFCADVYVNSPSWPGGQERVYCGRGGMGAQDATREALDWCWQELHTTESKLFPKEKKHGSE